MPDTEPGLRAMLSDATARDLEYEEAEALRGQPPGRPVRANVGKPLKIIVDDGRYLKLLAAQRAMEAHPTPELVCHFCDAWLTKPEPHADDCPYVAWEQAPD